MKSDEIEQLVQVVTNKVMERLGQFKHRIILRDPLKYYPASYIDVLSQNYELMSETKQGSNAALLCLSKITTKQIVTLAHLMSTDELTDQVLDFLLQDKPVWIFSKKPQIVEYQRQTRYGVWKEIQDALQKLEHYNIHFIYDNSSFNLHLQALSKTNKAVNTKYKYITLTKLQERLKNHQQLLQDNEKMTDLAKDWARSKDLKL